jgi:phosphoribosylanthranilate isomerase
MIKAKICGLTRKEDALFAAYNGADAIGVVNVRESKRYVKLSDAREIFRAMPPFVSRVLVASPARLSEVKEIERTGADYLQLHSVEDIMFIKEIRENTRMRLIKQLAVTGRESIEQAELYSSLVDAILLDTKTKDCMGGTGVVHDWDISREIVARVKKPAILAGGLNPANVLDAIAKVAPYAVDVASGVEITPGIKDTKKIEEFIKRVRAYEIT